MQEFWSGLEGVLERGESAWVAIVVRNTRHSPGTRGARLFVSSGGVVQGTIGGGGMEKRLVDEARRKLAQGAVDAPRLERLVHRRQPESGVPSGLICAGEQTNLYATLTPDDLGFVSDVADMLAHDRPGVMRVSAEGWDLEMRSPRKGDHWMRLDDEGEDWCVEEQVLRRRRVAVMGGGHCGLALSRVLSGLGAVVTVFDVRQELATLDDNHYARYIHVVEDYADAASRISYPQHTPVVVMTADFPSDVRALYGLAKTNLPVPFIGVMGASAKLRAIHKALKELDVSDEFLARIVSPVGLPMKSDTPPEIAISVAGQLLTLDDF